MKKIPSCPELPIRPKINVGLRHPLLYLLCEAKQAWKKRRKLCVVIWRNFITLLCFLTKFGIMQSATHNNMQGHQRFTYYYKNSEFVLILTQFFNTSLFPKSIGLSQKTKGNFLRTHSSVSRGHIYFLRASGGFLWSNSLTWNCKRNWIKYRTTSKWPQEDE